MLRQKELFESLVEIEACPETKALHQKLREFSQIYTDIPYYYNEILAESLKEIYNSKFDEYLMYNLAVAEYLVEYVGLVDPCILDAITLYSEFLKDKGNNDLREKLLVLCGLPVQLLKETPSDYLDIIINFSAKAKIDRMILHDRSIPLETEVIDVAACSIEEIESHSNAELFLSISANLRRISNSRKLSALRITGGENSSLYDCRYKKSGVNTAADCYFQKRI